MRKDILFVTPFSYPYYTGGLEIFNYYLKNRLKETFNVSYLSFKDSNINRVKYHRLFGIRPIKYLIPLQTLLYLLFHPKTKMTVISYSYGHGIMWYLYSWIRTLLRRDYIAVIHNGREIPKEGRKKRACFFRNAYKVIAVSEDIKNNYDAIFGTDCEVQYPLVPLTISNDGKEDLRTKYNIPINATVVSMVGSIIPLKNPDTLLEALEMCTEQEVEQHNIHIVYAGGGFMLEDFMSRVKQCRFADRVHLLGIIHKESVKEIFKLSDIYVIASDFEGTSVSLLEAMYNSLAIIASRAPGITKTVTENEDALMFTTKNAEELKTCLLRMYSDNDLKKAISLAAKETYEKNYSYDKMIDEYIKILNKE